MNVFGIQVEQLYMYILLGAGALSVLCVFFGEDPEFGEVVSLFHPIVLFSFLTCGSAIGLLLEKATTLHEWLILGIAVLVALLFALVLHYLLLLPLSSASNTRTEDSLSGQVANVIVPIPADGYGEVVVETYAGRISKRATGYTNEAFDEHEKVVVLEVSEGILYVQAYQTVPFDKKKPNRI